MIIIDTHILLWWKLNDDSLKIKYRDILEQNQSEIIGVSAVSLMEIICLYDRDRINLSEDPKRWIAGIIAEPRITAVSISAKIAIDAFRLPGNFHKDPADRIIVASARVHNCPILSQDAKITEYYHVKHI